MTTASETKKFGPVYYLSGLEEEVETNDDEFKCCVCGETWSERRVSIDAFSSMERCLLGIEKDPNKIYTYLQNPICHSCYDMIRESICGICGLTYCHAVSQEIDFGNVFWTGKKMDEMDDDQQWFKCHMYEHIRLLLDEKLDAEKILQIIKKFDAIKSEFKKTEDKFTFHKQTVDLYHTYHQN